MKKITTKMLFALALSLILGAPTQAQTNIKLKVNHLLGSEDFGFQKIAKNDIGNEFVALRLEYYISGITLIHDGGQETTLNTYILQDAADDDTVSIGSANISSLESLSFFIGVDKTNNHADPSKWPSSHALAPKSPSMHWGWASGYRFVALEGATGANMNNKFAIHALGDKNYFEMNIPTTGEMINNNLVIVLNADYTKLLSQINLSTGVFNHGEDDEAAELLRNFQTKVFTNMSGEGNTLSVEPVKITNAFSINPNPSHGNFNIQVLDSRLLNAEVEIRDLTGRIVSENTYLNNLPTLSAGVYLVAVKSENIISTQKLIVN